MYKPKFANICFCCLSENGQFKNMLEEAFISSKIKVQFMEGYTVCSGISPDDRAIKNICSPCEDKLKQAYEFRQLCCISYKTLTEREALFCVDVKREVVSDSDAVIETVYLPDTLPKIEEHVVESMSSDDIYDPSEESNTTEPRQKRFKKMKTYQRNVIPAGTNLSKVEANYICYHCDKALKTHNEYVKHRKKHIIGKRHSSLVRVCNLCQVKVSRYYKHIAECHKDYRPNVCIYCPVGRFQTASELKNHLASHVEGESSHQCQACQEKFKSELALRGHINQHRNPNNSYFCPYCGLEFARFLHCRDHFAAHHDPAKKLYPCFSCKRTYTLLRSYDEHDCPSGGKDVDAATGPQCRICCMTFSCDDALDCHQARGCFAEKATSRCHTCGKEFEMLAKLKRHLKTHDPTRRLFVCDTCGHTAINESQLNLHKFMHVTDRPFQCQLCPATFKLNQHLRGHQKVHRPAPYTCYLCERKFRTYDNIRLHMGIHSNASVLRRFACELCGKTSVSGTALSRHMKTHTHEKDFKCDLCDRKFRDIGGVNRHVKKVHDGLFYECKSCGKTYKEKMKFRNHLYVHRGFKPYNCPVCPAQHVEKYIFIKHLRTQHQINYVEKIHGYREMENINALIEECQRIPLRKDDGQTGGTDGRDAADQSQMNAPMQTVDTGFGAPAPQPYMQPMQYENKY